MLATDPSSQRVLLFGGGLTPALSSASSELWQWTGSTWSLVGVTGAAPLERANAAMCVDNGGLLMFGGYRPGNVILSAVVWWDTWRFQSGVWSQVAVTGPTPRQLHAMAETPQGVLLFGGTNVNFTASYGDTWRWNGASWTQLAPATSPPARRGHRMAWDASRGVVVLFGGRDSNVIANYFADTWEWNGSTWLQRLPAHSPPPRAEAAMAYSPSRQRVVLSCGIGSALFNDSWAWDGSDWVQLTTSAAPPPRSGAELAFAPGSQGGVAFGGYDGGLRNDTWLYFDAPASAMSFGTGCVGPNALTPSLGGVAGELPRLGTTFHFRVGNLPAGYTVPMLAIGLSNTVAGGPPPYVLPFDLGVLGWPGCQQLVSLDSLAANVSFGTTSDFPLAVPLDGALLGFTCHGQAIVFYPTGEVAVSNGLTVVVGA